MDWLGECVEGSLPGTISWMSERWACWRSMA